MTKLIWLILIIFMLSTVLVLADTTHDILAPLNYLPSSVTLINFSANITNTDDEDTLFNLNVYNKSSSSGDYSLLFSANITNSTFWNRTFTLKGDKEYVRHWIYFNFTNLTSSGVVSNTRVIDIDTDLYIISLGPDPTINFSVDSGDIKIKGVMNASAFYIPGSTNITNNIVVSNNITVDMCNFRNISVDVNCGASNIGTMFFNATDHNFYGCNGSNWNAFA